MVVALNIKLPAFYVKIANSFKFNLAEDISEITYVRK